MNSAKALVKILEAQGVKYVFGIPGTHILAVFDELATSNIKTIQTTQEQSAAFMADVYGRVKHESGVILVTSGPGVLNTVNAVAQAYVESSPVLLIGSQVNKKMWGKGCYHELKNQNVQLKIFEDITKYCVRVESPDELENKINEAFYICRQGRHRPVFVEIPENIFEEECPIPSFKVKKVTAKKADEKKIGIFFEELHSAVKPLILAGGGVIAAQAQRELKEFSEFTGIPIITTVMGRSSCPEDFGLCLGIGSGILSTKIAAHTLKEADLIIAIGTRFDEIATGFFTLRLNGKLVHIDVDETEFNKNFEAHLCIVADAKEFLIQALEGAKKMSLDNKFKGFAKQENEQNVPLRLNTTDNGVNPLLLLEKLISSFSKKNTIIIGDSGNSSSWVLSCKCNTNMLVVTPSGYNSMGFSVPGGIGAKLASPESNVISVCGDGSFLMTGLEMMTAAKYGVNFICVVLHENRYNILTLFQDLKYGGRYSDTIIRTFDFAKFANEIGCLGFTLKHDTEIDGVIEKIVKSEKPVLIDVLIDPRLVPPILGNLFRFVK